MAPFNVFTQLGTQWRCGPAGFYGLDYTGVKALFELLRVPVDDWPELIDDIRYLESGALQAMNAARAEKK